MNCFFALISRMKYISRWALMRNTRSESLCEHTLETAVIAHALAVIGNQRMGKTLNAEKAAVLAMYHDASEILTGDMPTPVKYDNPEIKNAYKQVEGVAANKLLSTLPKDLKGAYKPLLIPESNDCELMKLVKAADKISALIKCIEEEKAGNKEFSKAAETIRNAITQMDIPEADCFVEEFLPSFSLSLDELN